MIREQVNAEPDESVRHHRMGRREVPIVGPRGLLTYGDRSVCLRPRNASLVGVLVHHFGTEVTDLELLDRGWPAGATRRTLRARLRRLDRRLARVGLRIADSGYRSHSLLPAGVAASGTAWSGRSAYEEHGHFGSMYETVGDRAEQ